MTIPILPCDFPLRPGRLWSLWDMINYEFGQISGHLQGWHQIETDYL
jgi:hypothetical protein